GGVALVYAASSALPGLGAMAVVLVAGMACLGLGNGAVFQLVPQSFRDEIGIATGVVGALGGVGGFALPLLLGAMKQATGSFAAGFAALAVVAMRTLGALSVRVARPSLELPADAGPDAAG